MLTPKQQEIYRIVKRFGKVGRLTAMVVGLALGQPRKKAEKWAKPALKELVKEKMIIRNGDTYAPKENAEKNGDI